MRGVVRWRFEGTFSFWTSVLSPSVGERTFSVISKRLVFTWDLHFLVGNDPSQSSLRHFPGALPAFSKERGGGGTLFLPPVVGGLLKKGLQKAYKRGGESRAPQDPTSNAPELSASFLR